MGKIYAGLLILENYRARKSGTEVSRNSSIYDLMMLAYTSIYNCVAVLGEFSVREPEEALCD